jgi:predicted outer membrane repeat protein
MNFYNAYAAYFEMTDKLEFSSNTATNWRGGGMYFAGTPRVSFRPARMYFYGNIAGQSGGGMYFDGSAVSFSDGANFLDMTFISNTARANAGGGMAFVNKSSATFNASNAMIFRYNWAASSGGAMYFDNSSAAYFGNAKTLEFTQNTARDNSGGGMYLGGVPIVSFKPSSMIFRNNYANRDGGGMYFSGSVVSFADANFGSMTFTSNTARVGSGGGMYFSNSSITFGANWLMVFERNVSSQSGGALYLDANSKARFDTGINRGNVNFTSNTAYAIDRGSGGAIYLSQSTMVFSAGGVMEFKYNEAAYGAVLYATNNSSVTFTRGSVTFERNTSSRGNGVISWDRGTKVDFTGLQGLTAIYNEAQNGGFLYILGAQFVLDASQITISSNVARNNGGAIYLSGSLLTFKGASDIPFINNVSRTSGGAIYLDGSTITFSADRMRFERNVSSYGAVLYGSNKTSVTFTQGDIRITSNTSVMGKGVVRWDATSSVSFRGLRALSAQKNVAVEGGFLYLENAGYTVDAGTITLSSNTARSGDGGAMSITGSNLLFRSSGTISLTGNSAVRAGGILTRGGAINALNGSKISFDSWTGKLGIDISGNEAGLGGGIYIGGIGAELNFANATTATMKGNIAQRGGAIYAAGGRLIFSRIEDLEFSGNIALSGEGGIIYATGIGAVLEFSSIGVLFTNNTGRSKGESIYISSAASIEFGYSTVSFETNRSSNGAAIYIYRGTFSADNSSITFARNTAYSSGTVYIDNGIVRMTNSTVSFVGNTAKMGSGIYMVGSLAEFGGGLLSFSGNVSDNGAGTSSGAAFYAGVGSTVIFRSREVSFENNTAVNGAGILYWDRAGVEFTSDIYSLRAIGNTADRGGFLYLANKTIMLRSTNTRIDNNEAAIDGGGLYLTGGAIDFNSKTTITFSSNSAIAGRGGAIYMDKSTGAFYGDFIKFSANVAIEGGAMYAGNRSALIFYNTEVQFTFNISTDGDGVIKWDNSRLQFSNLERLYAYKNVSNNGGFLYLSGQELTFDTQVKIVSNTARAREGNGGGLYLRDAQINFTRRSTTSFTGNTAMSRGGAIYLDNSSGTFSGNRIEFVGNTAIKDGGAIYAVNGSKILFSNTLVEFIDNESVDGDGVIHWENSEVKFGDLSGLNAINNKANDGGFLYLSGVGRGLEFETRMEISSNTARAGSPSGKGGSGGAFYVSNGAYIYINRNKPFEEARFAYNTAQAGGAIYLDRASGIFGGAKIEFTSNVASSSGGAVYVKGGSDIEFRSGELDFMWNVSKDGDGVVYWKDSQLSISSAVRMLRAVGNTANNGGFLYLENIGFKLDTNAQITSNIARGSISGGNGSGGAIYLKRSSMIFSENAQVEWGWNVAKTSGGAVYADKGSYIEFNGDDLKWSSNTAGFGGGVMYINEGSSVIFNNKRIEFSSNISQDGNGVVSWEKSLLEFSASVENLIAINNTANNGGFLYIKDSIFKLDTNAQMTSNTARAANGVGGAIYMEGSTMVFGGRSDIVWTRNTANSKGGAIYADRKSFGDFRGYETRFSSNTAINGGGGAAYISGGSTFIFRNELVVFEYNKSVNGNGVLSWDKGSVVIFSSGVGELDAVYNTAKNGGFIYIDGGRLELEAKSEISSNVAYSSGGALFLVRSTAVLNVNPYGINFHHNISTYAGGAFYASHSYILVSGEIVEFKSNTASLGEGSLIYGIWNTSVIFKSKQVNIESNTARHAGGIYLGKGSYMEFVNGVNMVIKDNRASSGAFIAGKDSRFLIDTQGIIKDNYAGTMGGAIYLERSTGIFGKNSISEIVENTANEKGGAIYSSASVMRFDGATITFARNISNSSGSAVYVDWGTVFEFNNAYLYFTSNTAGRHTAQRGDGALFWKRSRLDFGEKVKVLDAVKNTANNGAFLYLEEAVLNLNANSRMTYNTANTGSGGVMYIDRTTVTFGSKARVSMSYNTAYSSGGAIYSTGSLIMFKDGAKVDFENNTALYSGGAISGLNTKMVFEADMDFAHNTALGMGDSSGGGAIYLGGENSEIKFIGRRMGFYENISQSSGGAIYLTGTDSVISFERSQGYFQNNTASFGGGAVYIDDHATMTVKGAYIEFERNTGDGGAAYINDYGYLNIVDKSTVHFYENRSSVEKGGAILFVGNAQGYIGNSFVDFIYNKAQYGGGVYMQDDTKWVIRNSTVIFDRNIDSQKGGGIYTTDRSSISFEQKSRVYFSSNVASSSGGAIYAGGDSLIYFDVDLLEFRYNESRDGYGVVYEEATSTIDFRKVKMLRAIGNEALKGGFIYLTNRTADIEGSIEAFNNIGTAGEAGAVGLVRGSTLTISGRRAIFSWNTAQTQGGAMYIIEGSVSNIGSREVEFNYNRAKGRNGDTEGEGGAIYMTGNSKFDFRDSVNIDGIGNSGLSGGFAYIVDSYMIMNGAIDISGNEARTGSGGAFYVENSILTIDQGWAVKDSKISGNIAWGEGGAIYMKGSTVTIEAETLDTVFSGNLARAGILGFTDNDIYIDEGSLLNLHSQNTPNRNEPDRISRLKLLSGILGVENSLIIKSGKGVAELGGYINYRGKTEIRQGAIEINQPKDGVVSFADIYVENAARYGTVLGSGIHKSIADNAIIEGTLEVGINYVDYEADILASEGTIELGANSVLEFKEHNFVPTNGKEGWITIAQASSINGRFSNYPDKEFVIESEFDNPLWSRWTLRYYGAGEAMGRVDDINYGYDRISLNIESKYKISGVIEGLSNNESEIGKSLENAKDIKTISALLEPLSALIRKDYESGNGYEATKEAFAKLSGKFLSDIMTIGAQNRFGALNTKIKQALRIEDRQSVLQSIWVQGSAEYKEFGEEGYNVSGQGITAGFPLWRGEHDLGLYIGYNKQEAKEGIDRADIRDIEIGLYGGLFSRKNINVKANIGGAVSSFESKRRVEFEGYSAQPVGEFDAHSIRFGIEAEYEKAADSETKIKPFIGINGGITFNPEYQEKDGKEVNMKVESNKYLRADAAFGIKAEDNKGAFNWNGKVYMGYILAGESPKYEMRLEHIDYKMEIEASKMKQTYGGAGVWAEYRFENGLSIFVNGDVKVGQSVKEYYGNIGINYRIWGISKEDKAIDEEIQKRKEAQKSQTLVGAGLKLARSDEAQPPNKQVSKTSFKPAARSYEAQAQNEEDFTYDDGSVLVEGIEIKIDEDAIGQIEEEEKITEKSNNSPVMQEQEYGYGQEENEEEYEAYAPLRLIVAKFGQKEYKINEQSKKVLKVLAQEIKKSRYMRVIVISKSSRLVRMEIAARRAKSVYDELYRNGVNIDRMEYIDIGLEEASKSLGLPPATFKTNQVEVIVEYLR